MCQLDCHFGHVTVMSSDRAGDQLATVTTTRLVKHYLTTCKWLLEVKLVLHHFSIVLVHNRCWKMLTCLQTLSKQ